GCGLLAFGESGWRRGWRRPSQTAQGFHDVDAEKTMPADLTEILRKMARLKARCHALEEQLGKLTELYDVTQARLEAFEEQEPDARTCAEWVATVALKSSDVHSAACRYLCGEQRGIVAQ